MGSVDFDEVDRGILGLLQEDARNNTATAIAEQVGVTATTVSNRIDRLEAAGVIRGYHPRIDYERAGFPLHLLFVCTAAGRERAGVAGRTLDVDGVAGRTLDVDGVVSARETVTDRRNLHVDVVARTADDVEAAGDALRELGFEIAAVDVVRERSVKPWNPFEDDATDRDESGG